MNRQRTLMALAATALALVAAAGRAAWAGDAPREQAQAAAPAAAVLEHAAPGTVVFDDDGGRAEIVSRRAAPRSELSYHGGPVIAGGTVRAIFLGRAWRQSVNRSLESRIMDGFAGRGPESLAALSRFGVAGREIAWLAQEDLVDPLDGAQVSDLEIQARLSASVGGDDGGGGAGGSDRSEPLAARALYVVFLAPGLRSTLGASSSESDFAAYHNHFHAAAGAVHYVVVPYDGEFARWLSHARLSLAQALINPEGNGWY